MRVPDDQTVGILRDLARVADTRHERISSGRLNAAVMGVKAFQARRFENSYADLMANPRYAPAARFFLSDLYGPSEFHERDRQFARVVPSIAKLFPDEVLNTVCGLAKLHAVTESMDLAMGKCLVALDAPGPIGWAEYRRAWGEVGEPQMRALQLDLTVQLGKAMNRLTQKKWLRQSLRLMRKPANAAGLGELQWFLERGFDAFGNIGDASEFLDTITSREQALITELFANSD